MPQQFPKLFMLAMVMVMGGLATAPAQASWFNSKSSDTIQPAASAGSTTAAPLPAPAPVGTTAVGTGAPPPSSPITAVTSNPAPVKKGKDVVDQLNADKTFSTFASAIKSAGLQPIFAGAGPFTVFAPTDKAFDKLPKGTLDSLLKPENKGQLTRLLVYHMVAGNFTLADLAKQAKAGNGQAQLYTVQAGMVTLKANGNELQLIDTSGHAAIMATDETPVANGIIHPIDTVLGQ